MYAGFGSIQPNSKDSQPPGYATPQQRRGVQPPVGGRLAGLGGEVPVSFSPLRDGYPGTVEIINAMVNLARMAFQNEEINLLARKETMSCPRHDHLCEARTLLAWMQKRFRYTRLPTGGQSLGLQRLQTPLYTLFESPVSSGECASLSTALAAMLMSLGHEVRFKTGGQSRLRPNDYEHVWLIVNLPNIGWQSLYQKMAAGEFQNK